MATLPLFRRNAMLEGAEAPSPRLDGVRTERDPFLLRSLPHDDVIFYCKKIDNSRLVREADPHAGGACWTAIGVACLALLSLGGVAVPNVANTIAGYKLEALRGESQSLADERRKLEVDEAQLLSPERLDRLARDQNLVTPSSDQVVHLENRTEGKVAMVKK